MAQSNESSVPAESDEIKERDTRYLNYALIAVLALGVISGVYTFFFFRSGFVTTLAVFVGLTIGVVTAYYYHESFSAEDRELMLGPDEHVLLESSNPQTFISIPAVLGGVFGKAPPLKVNLFLTDKGIIAEPVDVQEFDEEGRLYYFQINHSDITKLVHESNFMSDHIRLTYRGPNMQEQEILILAGDDTPKWVDQLTAILGMESI